MKDRIVKYVQCVFEGHTCGSKEGEWRRLKWDYMVDKLHTWKRTKKPLATALSGTVRELIGRDGGYHLTMVHYKPIWNFHYESTLYNEYIINNLYINKEESVHTLKH
jgi:hypothetical protein